MQKQIEFLEKINNASIKEAYDLCFEFAQNGDVSEESDFALMQARHMITQKRISLNESNTKYPKIWNIIKKNTKNLDLGRYDLSMHEYNCIRDIYADLDIYALILTAYKFGFSRGIMKHKNELKKNKSKSCTGATVRSTT